MTEGERGASEEDEGAAVSTNGTWRGGPQKSETGVVTDGWQYN